MLIRTWTAVATAFLPALWTAVACAQDTAACNAAYEQADLLLHSSNTDRPLEARDQLRVCASASCKDWMVKDCSKWLGEVEARIPTVVFVAKTPDGNEPTDVTVSEAGKVMASRLDGTAIEIDPGDRLFVFATADGRHVEQRAMIKEGAQAQIVTATLPAAGETDASRPRGPVPSATSAPSHGSPTRLPGLVIAGAGVAGIVIGSAFGLAAISRNQESNAKGYCSSAGCTALGEAERDAALSDATASTVAFVVGGVLAAAGLVLIVLPSPNRSTTAAQLEMLPSAGPQSAGLSLRGHW